MTLALRLGRTLHELKNTLPASELKLWMQFDRISPIGDGRADQHAAQITAAVFNAQGGNVSLDDALLKWQAAEVETEENGLEGFLGKLAD
jgi:hypothetical protein